MSKKKKKLEDVDIGVKIIEEVVEATPTLKKETREEVHMPCKRSADRAYYGQSCDGRKAYKASSGVSTNPRFTCTKCNYSWVIPLGGQFVGF